jgi:hypothetical protein
MRLFLVSLLAVALLFTTAGAHREGEYYRGHSDCSFNDDDLSVEFDDDVLVMEFHDEDVLVEIMPDYDLYVDGELIELGDEQSALVEDYYNSMVEVVYEAQRIGYEGAKIGMAGAAIGIESVAGVLAMFFTSYDSDDLERDVERKASRLEARAEELERKAEKLEEMAEDLEDLWSEMCDEIPALEGLD